MYDFTVNRLSDMTRSCIKLYSRNAIIEYMENKRGIPESTVASHLYRRHIPENKLEAYLDALKNNVDAPASWEKSEQKVGKDKDISKLALKARTTLSEALIGYYKAECGLYMMIKGYMDYINTCLNSLMDDKYALFLYRLNYNFSLFSSLNSMDIKFLIGLSVGAAKQMNSKLTEIRKNSTLQDVSKSGEYRRWSKLIYNYYPPAANRSDPRQSIHSIMKKINKAAKPKPGEFYEGFQRLFFIGYIMSIIWPKEDATDTAIGPEEIRLLSIFKLALTVEEQKSFLAAFSIK